MEVDHYALRCIIGLADGTGKFSRWRLRMSEYEFDVVHCMRVEYQAADAISPVETDGLRRGAIDNDIITLI